MIKMKDLVLEGRQIQETFNKNMVNEFSPMGEIHTLLEIDLDVTKMTTNIANKYAPKDIVKNIQQGLIKIVNDISKKHGGKFTIRKSQSLLRTLVIEWDHEMEQSEFDKIYNELKIRAEKTFNTNLFEFYTAATHFKKTGALGTSIGKDKTTNWLTEFNGQNLGQGGEYAQEYGQFLNGLQSKHPEFDKKEMQYKIGKVLSSYFKKNPKAVVRKTDWLSDVKPQIEKLYV